MNRQCARILVVDDEAAIRCTLDALLRRQVYAVWTAADGAEAFSWLREMLRPQRRQEVEVKLLSTLKMNSLCLLISVLRNPISREPHGNY
ncbi:MAG TPA: hypothetical protein VFX76_19410 [Roseiflexaceae bacterium]|nr:hypothetical protein [Roseiflexaceae bacterium]